MFLRGVRGATTVLADQESEILAATTELLAVIQQTNPTLQAEDIASVFFTVTDDLCSTYPAKAARLSGWANVPLMCAREIPVPGGLPRCIRVLIHWNTDLPQPALHHIYLKDAVWLRPDLAAAPPNIEHNK